MTSGSLGWALPCIAPSLPAPVRRTEMLGALFGNLGTYGESLVSVQGTVQPVRAAGHRTGWANARAEARRANTGTPAQAARGCPSFQTSLRRSQMAVVRLAWFML